MAMTLAFLDHLESRLISASSIEEILPILQDPRDFTPPAARLAMKARAWTPVVTAAWGRAPSACPVQKKVPLDRQGSRVVDSKGKAAFKMNNWTFFDAVSKLKSQSEAGIALFRCAMNFTITNNKS